MTKSPLFVYEIVKQYGILSQDRKNSKELNLIRYGSAEPKIDLRNWAESEDGTRKMLKGITLTISEAKALRDILDSLELEEPEEDNPEDFTMKPFSTPDF